VNRSLIAGLFLTAACLLGSPAGSAPASPLGDARLEALSFADLPGWESDDHAAALRAFGRTCEPILAGKLEPVASNPDNLRSACRTARDVPAEPDKARRFFERSFEPVEVVPASGAGFLTGYFEPEVEGSLEPSAAFPTPLLARPDDLVSFAPGEGGPGLDPRLAAARRTSAGLEPYPDRAAIESGALGARARPVAFVRDPVELFIIQVQGSARLRLPDGSTLRVAYDGRNGHPYTSIGRILVERRHVPLAEMNLERLTSWLRDNPAEAAEIMRRNRSYVFFRRADEIAPGDGPIGGAGIPLTPMRSLAVDRSIWSYGLPVWLEGELPRAGEGAEPLRRLMIAQDTGTAIVGPARGDFFFGSGPEAGTRAGLLRHPVRFVVLRPRPSGSP
jgi:membrane-bound lytic murein transglycosylase A